MKKLVLCTLLLLGNALAPADERQDFYDQYGPHYDRAAAHFWTNVRVAQTRKLYDTALGGKYLCTEHVQAIAGASDSLVYRLRRTDVQPGTPKVSLELAGLHADGVSYSLYREAGSQQFAIDYTFTSWNKLTSSASYYSAYNGVSAGLDRPFFAAYIGRGPNRYHPPEQSDDGRLTLSVTRGRHRGADCVVVRTEAPMAGGTQSDTVYLRLPDYLVIGRESHGLFSMVTRTIEPTRKVVEVDYGPPTENGLPFPTRVKGWYYDLAGKKLPAEDVEFTEYRRYTPTPDEVDLEKQFGVKPLPVPPRPPLPPEGHWLADGGGAGLPARQAAGWSARWLYAGAGLLAAVTAGLVFLARRKRPT